MPEKRPTKFSLFLQKKPETEDVIEYIIAENLIQSVKFNGVNCVEIFIRGGVKLSYTRDASTIFQKLKTELAPTKIN
jgi:hypothetical protein